MSTKSFFTVCMLGFFLYFLWGYLLDIYFKKEEPEIKNFKVIEITYKPVELIVILSHDKGGN